MADTPVAQLQSERAAAERELQEIALLLRQARTEADRHEARRQLAEDRFLGLLGPRSAESGVLEAHEQLMLQAQRTAMMNAQIDVLEGKHKVLQRLTAGLDNALSALAGLPADQPAGLEGAGHTGTFNDAAGGAGGGRVANVSVTPGSQSRVVLAAQEEMRRSIARQMHDGPAQSIANIALQAQVVQRLLARDPAAAENELGELRTMVQHALEATKTFIFDVRPMVLDDLGLLATLRRAAGERQRRSGVPVRFESAGADRRLAPEVEIGLFRIVDDVLAAFLAAEPLEAALRLDWTDEGVTVRLRSKPPEAPAGHQPLGDTATTPDVPSALAQMIADQDAGVVAREQRRQRRYGLSEELWRDLDERARAVGVELTRADDGLRVEATLRAAIGTTR